MPVPPNHMAAVAGANAKHITPLRLLTGNDENKKIVFKVMMNMKKSFNHQAKAEREERNARERQRADDARDDTPEMVAPRNPRLGSPESNSLQKLMTSNEHSNSN